MTTTRTIRNFATVTATEVTAWYQTDLFDTCCLAIAFFFSGWIS
jgi:hypothetical protein